MNWREVQCRVDDTKCDVTPEIEAQEELFDLSIIHSFMSYLGI